MSGRVVGFSTGALARGDYRRALDDMATLPVQAVELSALRERELPGLVEASSSLDTSAYRYVSVHAPSRLGTLTEVEVSRLLRQLPASWAIVVHPDVIHDYEPWRQLGSRLLLENMDARKIRGQSVEDLARLFELLPDAGFCLDVGHARQVDPTMALAFGLIRAFARRLRQVHVSDVGHLGQHRRIGATARSAYRRIAPLVPAECPLILESVVGAADAPQELVSLYRAFPFDPVATGQGEVPAVAARRWTGSTESSVCTRTPSHTRVLLAKRGSLELCPRSTSTKHLSARAGPRDLKLGLTQVAARAKASEDRISLKPINKSSYGPR